MLELHRKDGLFRKGIAAWKTYSYRMRVQRYLENKFKLRIGERFLGNLREQFFQIKTEKLKEHKAVS